MGIGLSNYHKAAEFSYQHSLECVRATLHQESEFICVSVTPPPQFLTKTNRNNACSCSLLKPVPLQKENFVKHKSLSVLLALLLLCSYSPLAFSQQTASSNDWSIVQQIKTNEDLIVKKKDGKQHKGSMIEASETTLTIDRNGKPLSIARADVRQVYVIEAKAEKGKWAWIGAGIGAGAGAGIGATKYSTDRDDSGIYVGMGLLIGTGAGAVGGLLFGQSRRQRLMVYDAR
jgi:hypothetical protein